MASTIVVPTPSGLGNYPPQIAASLITVATQAAADITALQAAAPATVAPLNDGIPAVGTSLLYARQDHVHPATTSLVHFCRYVMIGNVASLASFTVLQDGVTGVAGDRVLLVGQTTPSQNGIWVVGVVAGGIAPLTRTSGSFLSGVPIQNGCVVEVSEGILWAGNQFKAFCTGPRVVDTDDPIFYPRNCRALVTLAAGAYTLGSAEGLMLRSTTRSAVAITRDTANTSTATTGGYTSPVATRTAGIVGTAAVLVRAEVAAGTLNNADLSTLLVTVINY